MDALSPRLLSGLRAGITGDVFVPGDDGYETSLRRWSATCVKPAVSSPRNCRHQDETAGARH